MNNGLPNKPRTRRCVYCGRPEWTWGERRYTWKGRLYDILWPAHIIGPDYGPPYTDGLCPDAAHRMDLWLERQAHIKAGLPPPVYKSEPKEHTFGSKEIEVADVLIAIFAAIILIQYGWICQQDRRIDNYKTMLMSMPIDERTQGGGKP